MEHTQTWSIQAAVRLCQAHFRSSADRQGNRKAAEFQNTHSTSVHLQGIIFLGLSRNPVGNSGAKALAEAASASTQEPRDLS